MQAKYLFGLNGVFSSGLLTATGAEAVYDTTVTLVYSINGKIATKTAITDGAAITVDGVTGVAFRTLTGTATGGQGTVHVWCLVAGGTVKVVEGSRETLNAAGTFDVAPQFPTLPDTHVPFAYQVLKNYGTANVFTPGTSNWNATGASNAIVNVSALPDRPQVS